MPRVKLLVVLAVAVAAVTGSAARGAAGTVANPGFEADGTGTSHPSGWHTIGIPGASFTEAGGHSGSFRLSHWSQRRFVTENWQTVTGLQNGWYTLRAWVKRSPGTNDSYIALRFCGGREARTYVPVARPDQWLQITVSTQVRFRECTIVLHTDADAGEWTNFDDVELVPGAAQLSVLGADVSSLEKSEDKGGVYRDDRGRPGDALRILRDHGLNWIRLRVWVDPADGYHDKAELLTMAKRAKALGIKVLVDLHYSDFWADPGKQWTPAAWDGQTFPQLLQTLTSYTRDIVSSLVAQGTPPDMIQLGNELNSGLLWDYGANWTGCSTADDGTGNNKTVCHTEDWPQLAQLLTAGYDAVKSVSPSTRVALHVANGGDNGTFRWWFDNVTQRGVPFDVIAVSYYNYWHGSLGDLQSNLDDIAARYGKDIVIAETAYPFTLADDDGWPNVIGTPDVLVTGYPATPAGQASNFRDVMSIVRAVPNGHGLGVFYWDATWTGVKGNGWSPTDPSSGNAWENQALFDFSDRPTPAMDDFRP
jgi:arabinogalactan endo-1,4-beta-galactosidase